MFAPTLLCSSSSRRCDGRNHPNIAATLLKYSRCGGHIRQSKIIFRFITPYGRNIPMTSESTQWYHRINLLETNPIQRWLLCSIAAPILAPKRHWTLVYFCSRPNCKHSRLRDFVIVCINAFGSRASLKNVIFFAVFSCPCRGNDLIFNTFQMQIH